MHCDSLPIYAYLPAILPENLSLLCSQLFRAAASVGLGRHTDEKLMQAEQPSRQQQSKVMNNKIIDDSNIWRVFWY